MTNLRRVQKIVKDNPSYKLSDFDYSFQILDFEQDLYAETAKAYLNLYAIKDKEKSAQLLPEITKLEEIRVKFVNHGVIYHVKYIRGKPQYDGSFITHRDRSISQLRELKKPFNEILSAIYAIQGKVWEPNKEQTKANSAKEEEEKQGFQEPQAKQVTATGRQTKMNEEEFMTRWMKYVSVI